MRCIIQQVQDCKNGPIWRSGIPGLILCDVYFIICYQNDCMKARYVQFIYIYIRFLFSLALAGDAHMYIYIYLLILVYEFNLAWHSIFQSVVTNMFSLAGSGPTTKQRQTHRLRTHRTMLPSRSFLAGTDVAFTSGTSCECLRVGSWWKGQLPSWLKLSKSCPTAWGRCWGSQPSFSGAWRVDMSRELCPPSCRRQWWIVLCLVSLILSTYIFHWL